MSIFEILQILRNNTLKSVESLSTSQLNLIPNGHNNNIIWHLGHMVVTQQLLCYSRSGAKSYLAEETLDKYRKGTSPKEWTRPVALEEIRPLLLSTAEVFEKDYQSGKLSSYEPYVTSAGVKLSTIDEAIIYNYGHENLHYGNILTMLKMVKE